MPYILGALEGGGLCCHGTSPGARLPLLRRAGPLRAPGSLSRGLRGALPFVGRAPVLFGRSKESRGGCAAPFPPWAALCCEYDAVLRRFHSAARWQLSPACVVVLRAVPPALPGGPVARPVRRSFYKTHHDGWHETLRFWSRPAPIAANTGAFSAPENSRRARLAVRRRRGYFLGCALGLPVHGGAVSPLRCSVGPVRVAFPARALCRRSGHFSVALHSRKKAGPGGARAGPALLLGAVLQPRRSPAYPAACRSASHFCGLLPVSMSH